MWAIFLPFQREYRDLAEQLSDYTVKCLDRVRTQKELEIVLNKTGRPTVEKYESLARFKLALKFKEKKVLQACASCVCVGGWGWLGGWVNEGGMWEWVWGKEGGLGGRGEGSVVYTRFSLNQ